MSEERWDAHSESSLFPPAAFSAWLQTCEELASAIAAGPRLVALVGGEGSGKTFTLRAVAASLPGRRACVRAIGAPLLAGVAVDLMDSVGSDIVRALSDEPAFEGVRVVAVRPEAATPLLQFQTDTRLVRMRPMSERDVCQMVRSRQVLHKLPQDAFAPGALSALNRHCNGNPARLDRLIERALRGRNGPQIGAADIERAERELSPHAMDTASAWDLLHSPIDPATLARAEHLARRRVLKKHAGGAVAGVAVAAVVAWGVTVLPPLVEQAAEIGANKLARFLDDMDRRPGPMLSATRSATPGTR